MGRDSIQCVLVVGDSLVLHNSFVALVLLVRYRHRLQIQWAQLRRSKWVVLLVVPLAVGLRLLLAAVHYHHQLKLRHRRW